MASSSATEITTLRLKQPLHFYTVPFLFPIDLFTAWDSPDAVHKAVPFCWTGYSSKWIHSARYICMYSCSIGVITNIFPVYNKRGHVDIVSRTAELSMQAAVEEVQALVHYESD